MNSLKSVLWKSKILFSFRDYCSYSHVPTQPYIQQLICDNNLEINRIDLSAIIHLERLSLVNFGNLKGVDTLESSIKFAQSLLVNDTRGIQPLTTVLEDRILPLQNDLVGDQISRKLVMANAKVTEEEYYIAPPGNIPLDSRNMDELGRKMLDQLFKFGFFKAPVTDQWSKTFSFGPLAMMLASNIRNEWIQNNVTNTDLNVFILDGHPSRHWTEDCTPSFKHVLQLNNERLPFGLVSVLNDPCVEISELSRDAQSEFNILNNSYRRLIFINEKDSQQYFYRLQQKHRIWWRKFATDPERFKIVSEESEGKKDTIQISATLPWETKTVETICNHGSEPLSAHGSLFEVKVGRKKALPHVIESVCLENPAVMTYLSDAYHSAPNRTTLRFHHSLSPYKTALAVNPTDERVEELVQLSTFLCLNLRRAGLQTLNSQSKKPLEAQFSDNDSIGVPYTVVATADTLTTGLLSLRSRDTTLKEQIHISRLTQYMQQLLRK